jgi:hypothetical protein
MVASTLDKKAFKQALKEALGETLQEQRALFHDIFAEVLEDFLLAEAISEGRKSRTASRAEVFRLLRNKE